MREAIIERVIAKPPAEVWPLLSDLGCWLEPDMRWRIDHDETTPGSRLVARLWEKPGTSSQLVIELDEGPEGTSLVTVTETQDRSFNVDARLSTRPGTNALAMAGAR